MIDLHVHSTFSDGSLTPEQLAGHAQDIGLTAMALTDHDCTGGIDSFMAACNSQLSRLRPGFGGQAVVSCQLSEGSNMAKGNGQKLIGISGVEISADVRHGTMHMLGYFINHKSSDLDRVLVRIREGRKIRNQEILRKLNDLGFDLTWDEVVAFAGESVVGRPHFAQAMVARGHVISNDAAFKSFLAKGKPAYADRFRLSPGDCISVIFKSGGVPVLAHPSTLELDEKALRKFVGELADMGLQGIEAYYSEHSREQQQEYFALAEEFKLAVTGGSDFHGKINPGIKLGRGFGSLSVPDGLVDELRRRRVIGDERGG